jgi:arylsulfatase
MNERRFAVVIFLAAALSVTACGLAPEDEAPTGPPPNVVIVMVDTLRADHMSLYGYDRRTTPFIRKFASESLVFAHARSQSACTFPSVNSLLTSRYPAIFNRQEKGQLGIPDDIPAIAEILKANGYRTIAVSASPIVRATPSKYNPNGGFERGFDEFIEGCVWRHGGCVNQNVFEQLENISEPFFLYIHYMEPHGYYAPPPNYKKQFAGEYDGHEFIRNGNPNPIAKMLYRDGPKVEITDRDMQHLVDLYDDEIRFFDGVFRRLIGRLQEKKLFDNTMYVITGDHGEMFMEHGQIKHCRGVWNTVTHVPLVLRIPGVEGGRRLPQAVQNLDIVPTLLDYLEIDTSGFGFEGSSLRPLIEGHDTKRRYAFANQGFYRSADDGRFHLIFDNSTQEMTLFDMRSDPLEQSDLYDPEHPEVGRLREMLDLWLTNTGQLASLDEDLAAAKAKEDELRALGYLQ